jgi:autotransporter-associated beta strand protein
MGQGALSMTGSSALLQVESGNFSGVLAGNETLLKTGSGLLALSGANSYGGGTSISGGTLGVSSDGSLGASGTTLTLDGGALQADGTLISSRDVVITGNNGIINTGEFSSTFSGIVSGAGGLRVEGQGSLNLSGANSYGGGTSISGGNLGVSSDGSLGASGTTVTLDGGTLLADANLASSRAIVLTVNNGGFNTGDFSSSLSGLVSGAGSLVVNGQGSVTLTDNNTYAGGTNLQGGTLACGVTQALGTGSVLVSGGTLESAGVPLDFSIGGNYNQGPDGTLKLGLGGGAIAYYDKVSVAGNTGLNGTLSLYSYGGLTPPPLGQTTAVLLSTGPLTGNFQQVEENLGDARLLPLYLSNALDLESIVPSFLALSATENERAIGADLDSTVFNAKLMLIMSQLGVLSAESLQTAEDQVSPEGLSALFQVGFEEALSRAALVDQRLSQFKDAQQSRVSPPGFSQSGAPLFAGNLTPVEEASMAAPQGEGDWSGFISGNGGIFNVAGDSNAAGYKVTTYGLTGAGADLRLSRDFALGLMAGFGQSNITLNGSGTLTSSGGQLGLYGLFATGGFYADALVEGGFNQYTSLRPSYAGTASGQTPGQEWSGAMKLGYGWKVDRVTLGPMASLQYTQVSLNGFSESGSLSPLTYPTQSQNSLMSRLGLQIDGHLNLGSAVLSPEVTVAWEHEYDDLGGNVEAGFGAGDSFTVAGPALGQNGVLAGAGVDMAFSKNFSVDLRYQGELNRTELNSQQFGGGLRLGF